jgi:hypothetical protein
MLNIVIAQRSLLQLIPQPPLSPTASTMGLKPTLTPEQQAVAAERRVAREAKRLALAAGVEQPVEEVEDPRARVLKREWIPARAAPGGAGAGNKQGVKIITWNVSFVSYVLGPSCPDRRWCGSGPSSLNIDLGSDFDTWAAPRGVPASFQAGGPY